MNIWVVVREVWDTRDLPGTPLDESGALRPGALTTRFDPEDLNALEAALRLKDEHGAQVTALSMGAPRDVDVLRECLFRGVDAVRRVEADVEGLDDAALGALAAGAIRAAGGADLVLVGTAVVDNENAMLGPYIAAGLGVETVSWVDAIESVEPDRVVAKRAVEMGYEYVEVSLPAVLSLGVALLEDDPRAPRSAKAMLKLKMKKADIPVVGVAEAGLANPEEAVQTRVAAMESIPPRFIESRDVDPEDPAALKAMMDELVKGA